METHEYLSNRGMSHLLGKAPQTINNEIKHELSHQQIRKQKSKLIYAQTLSNVPMRMIDPFDERNALVNTNKFNKQ